MSQDNPKACYLGWDVGGTKSAAVVGNADGDILNRLEWPSHTHRGPQAMLEQFLTHARTLLAEQPGVGGVGVSIGGPLNAVSGTILSPPHLPGWDSIPLRDILQNGLNLLVAVEHDAAACLLAEWLWGAARGATHAIYLTCGTGLGAGILIDGKILRGPTGQTPEAGHIRLAANGPVMFGKAGSAESFGSGEGIAKLAPFLFPSRFAQPTPARQLCDLAQVGDADARAILDESACRTGQLCSLLADLFAPQVIVLGSLARYLPPWWLEGVTAEFLRETLPENSRHTRIVPAGLGKRLQDLSAIAPCVAKT